MLILADDLGLDKVGVYGIGDDTTRPSTPNIDKLAADGLRFTNAYSYSNCSPTRAALLTGRYGFRTGIMTAVQSYSPDETVELDPAGPWLPRLLAGDGYRTVQLGKWHLGSVSGPGHAAATGWHRTAGTRGNLNAAQQSYDRFLKQTDGVEVLVEAYATVDTTNDAIAELVGTSEPWFAWVSYNAPHSPFHAPPPHLHGRDPNAIADDPVLMFQAMTEALDSEIGRLLNALGPQTLARTCIIFMGDNGTATSATVPPMRPNRSKATLYQGGVNVPLIVRGFGVGRQHQGLSTDSPVGCVDVFATVLDLAGVTRPSDVDGVSFRPTLRNPSYRPREVVYSERANNRRLEGNLFEAHEVMATNGTYKLLRPARILPNLPGSQVSLFDLSQAPPGRDGVNLCGAGVDCPEDLAGSERAAYEVLNAYVEELLE